MKKTFLFILITLFIGIQKNYAQENLTENQKLETLCKVWGFLKYYHPNVAKGIYNWDNQLIEKIKESEKIDTKKKFNKMLSSWIESLEKVEICTTCNQKNDKEYFLKNFDLSWTDDENIFSKDVIEKLNFVEENRNQGENFYAKTEFKTGQLKVGNEKDYLEKIPSKEIRLLELFRYWNLVEYFFPYKYKTDENWNDVLKEMIPKFTSTKNEVEYQIAILELITKIDDSHAKYYSSEFETFFGKNFLPTKVKFAEDQLVITEVFKNKINLNYDLQVGDVISKINNKTIPEVVEYYKKYVPASNISVKIRNIKNFNYFFRTKSDSIDLQIIRNSKIINIKVPSINNKDLVSQNKTEDIEKWKILENNIGIVNMGILEKIDVEKMYNELINTKAIIFDVRNYPKGTFYGIMKLMMNEKKQFCDFIRPDFNYPSKFIYENKEYFFVGTENNPNYYKGKVVILVNESTQSHAEYSTMALQVFPNSKVIGSQTAGADGNVSKFNITGKPTAFTGLGVFYPDGRETQRIGIVPDIEVKPTIKGIQESRDEVLERALEYIRTGK